MTKRIIFSAILGGIIAFIWGNISWVIMDWHQKTMHQFKDEVAVVKVLKDNASESGVYLLPQLPSDFAAKPGQDQKSIKAQHDARISEGPVATVAIALGPGDPSMKKQILQYLLTFLGYGLAISVLLACCSCGGYIGRVLYSGFLGLLLASYGPLLDVNWFHFSWDFALLNALDGLIAWTLAGIVMAAIVRKPKTSH